MQTFALRAPGPWSTNGTFVWPTTDRAVIEARGHLIALDVSPTFNIDGTYDHEQRAAHAALIAAAPTMLSALECVAESDLFGALGDEACKQVLAAIAKAEP